ncbi:MAG TPA: hypothetical protein VF304_10240 [Casimicrobiaceae bacterium]
MPRIETRPSFEAGQRAEHDGARGREARQFAAHGRQWHARFLGELQIESLTVFPQARKDIVHTRLLNIASV